ncbi:TPA: hypothetical protein ACPZQ5_004304 [Yersinia enterocolitica]
MPSTFELQAAKNQGALEIIEKIRSVVFAQAYIIGVFEGKESADLYIGLFDKVLNPLKESVEKSGGAI